MESYYINTDLDLVSDIPFDNIMRIFESSADVLHYEFETDGKWHATVEAEGSGFKGLRVPSDDILLLVRVIQSFDSMASAEWASLNGACFNIGWQSGFDSPKGYFNLDLDILKNLSYLAIGLEVSIYPSSAGDK